MNEMATLLAGHVDQAPMLARIAGFMLTAPPFSTRIAPRSAKAGFAVILWLCLAHEVPERPAGPVELLCLTELAVGLILGFAIQIAFAAFDTVGALLSNGMGLSVPGAFDPISSQSSGPLAGLTQILALAIFISADGLEMSISLLARSFDLLPQGFLPTAQALRSEFFALLLRVLSLALAGSVSMWGGLLLANALMLIAARLSGGLNLMNSGLPLLLALGLVLIGVALTPALRHIWDALPTAIGEAISGLSHR